MSRKRKHQRSIQVPDRPGSGKSSKTVNQIASEHNIHPNQVSPWKRQLLAEGPGSVQHGHADRDLQSKKHVRRRYTNRSVDSRWNWSG